MYMPPFKITAKIIDLISRISEKIGEINSLENSPEEKDLLKAHSLMMKDLVNRSGKYRNDGVGIFDGENVVHLAPQEWKDVFAWLPVETLVKENQADYYKALSTSDSNADSTLFTEFMLSMILSAVEEIIRTEKKVSVKVTAKVTANQKKIIEAIAENPYITQNKLAEIVGISRKSIIQNMKKLQENHFIERVGADKNGHWKVVE